MIILNLSRKKSLQNEQKPSSVKFMDMSTKSKNTSASTELVYIGGVGFMFEVNQSLKHNLISPDVLAFFDGVPESGVATKDCAFPLVMPNTNISFSLFQFIGHECVACRDGVYRKCQRIRCRIEYNGMIKFVIFHLDKSLMGSHITGVITKFQSEMMNKKYLHIAPSNSTAGALKHALNKEVVLHSLTCTMGMTSENYILLNTSRLIINLTSSHSRKIML